MPILAKDEAKTYHLTPVGMAQAVCFDVWDLGRQAADFKGKRIVRHRIKIGWELSELINSDDDLNGKRYTIYKEYTLSLNDKANLAKDLSSWRGRKFTKEEKAGFDLERLVGVNCLLNIVHNESDEKTYANISTVNPLPKGMPSIVPENDRSVPDWIQKIQAKAVDEPEVVSTNGNVDEDVPF